MERPDKLYPEEAIELLNDRKFRKMQTVLKEELKDLWVVAETPQEREAIHARYRALDEIVSFLDTKTRP